MMYASLPVLLLCLMFTVDLTGAAAVTGPRNNKTNVMYNFGLPYRVTDLVNMTIQVNRKHTGHIVIGLFGKTVPKATENFKALCTSRDGFGYKNTSFHRVLRDFLIQGGDFEGKGGKGGYSVYNDNPGRRFSAENFNIPHTEGSVAMAAEGRTRLGSQFYIVAARKEDVRYLNGKHVVFGHVVSGYKSMVQRMARVPTDRRDVPKQSLVITQCSVSSYVDPSDDLSKPVKKLLLDDDDFGQGRDGAHEGPKKPKIPVPVKNSNKAADGNAPAGSKHEAKHAQAPDLNIKVPKQAEAKRGNENAHPVLTRNKPKSKK